jgi:outer membrane receptor protein involved in Fe transport
MYVEDDGYEILNLRADLDAENWTVSFFVRNVFDKMAITTTRLETPPPPVGLRFVIPPRTIGFSATVDF